MHTGLGPCRARWSRHVRRFSRAENLPPYSPPTRFLQASFSATPAEPGGTDPKLTTEKRLTRRGPRCSTTPKTPLATPQSAAQNAAPRRSSPRRGPSPSASEPQRRDAPQPLTGDWASAPPHRRATPRNGARQPGHTRSEPKHTAPTRTGRAGGSAGSRTPAGTGDKRPLHRTVAGCSVVRQALRQDRPVSKGTSLLAPASRAAGRPRNLHSTPARPPTRGNRRRPPITHPGVTQIGDALTAPGSSASESHAP